MKGPFTRAAFSLRDGPIKILHFLCLNISEKCEEFIWRMFSSLKATHRVRQKKQLQNKCKKSSFHFISFISRAKHRWNTLTQDISRLKCYPSCCENKLTLVRLRVERIVPVEHRVKKESFSMRIKDWREHASFHTLREHYSNYGGKIRESAYVPSPPSPWNW